MPDRVLPFYVVCDESYSMTDHLDALNDGLAALLAAVGADPEVRSRVRWCLIGFAEDARVVVPLSPLSPTGRRPGPAGLAARPATNFGRAFRTLRATIEADVRTLRAQHCEVAQPAVFFLSDGQPTDPALWPAAYAELVDPAWPARPRVVAFGIGDADAATIGRIGECTAFLGDPAGAGPAVAVHRFARALADTMVRTGPGPLRVPEQVPGYVRVPANPV
jgi:uncharacterized protein YegL